jgi:acylphosphatase
MVPEQLKRVHVFVSGMVQGVNFRAHTQRKASSLGLIGFVRNLADGRVEAVFEGPETQLKEIITWCQSGPSTAHVDHVEVTWGTYQAEFRDFSVRR